VGLKVAFRQELIQYEAEKAMPHVTSIEELGQLRIIQRLLERRLGKLSEALVEQLLALNSDQLDLLADALLDFRTLGDLEAWLKQH
jgi:hypothetical protein